MRNHNDGKEKTNNKEKHSSENRLAEKGITGLHVFWTNLKLLIVTLRKCFKKGNEKRQVD